MTLKDDVALLRRAAQMLRPRSYTVGGTEGRIANELESLATRLEGCVLGKRQVYGDMNQLRRIENIAYNEAGAEFLRKLEGRE